MADHPSRQIDLDLSGGVRRRSFLAVLARGDAGVGRVRRVVTDLAGDLAGVHDLAVSGVDKFIADGDAQDIAFGDVLARQPPGISRLIDRHFHSPTRRSQFVMA